MPGRISRLKTFLINRILRVPLLAVALGLSLAVGLWIPTLYDVLDDFDGRHLTGHHPKKELAAGVSLLITLCIVAICQFRNATAPIEVATAGSQFRLRDMLGAMTGFAIMLALLPSLPFEWLTVGICLVCISIWIWTYRNGPAAWIRCSAWLCVLFVPEFWIITKNKPFGHTSGMLWVIPISPGILPAELVRGFVDSVGRDDVDKIAAVCVILLILVGVWLSRRGGRLYFICLTLVFALSGLSSLLLYALYRA